MNTDKKSKISEISQISVHFQNKINSISCERRGWTRIAQMNTDKKSKISQISVHFQNKTISISQETPRACGAPANR